MIDCFEWIIRTLLCVVIYYASRQVPFHSYLIVRCDDSWCAHVDLHVALRQLAVPYCYLQIMRPITRRMISFNLIRSYSQFTKNKPANLIRSEFLDYFTKDLKHSFIRSSPVSPITDSSLTFTNAGMNQVRFSKNLPPNKPDEQLYVYFSV